MRTSVVVENPLIEYIGNTYGCTMCNQRCKNSICLYAKDIAAAPIGEVWEIEEVDKCPNATERWVVSYTVVYKDSHGVALRYQNEEPRAEEIELLWVELYKGEMIK